MLEVAIRLLYVLVGIFIGAGAFARFNKWLDAGDSIPEPKMPVINSPLELHSNTQTYIIEQHERSQKVKKKRAREMRIFVAFLVLGLFCVAGIVAIENSISSSQQAQSAPKSP